MQVTPKKDSLFRWGDYLQTRKTLDKLMKSGIDSMVVYSLYYPGRASIGKDSCRTIDPVYSYFFWVSQGRYWFTKVIGQCESDKSTANGKVLQFTLANYLAIKEEFFMGAIMGATYVNESKTKLRITESSVDHEVKYSILILLNNQYKYIVFTQNALESEKSLFVDYNKKLTSFKLFKLIESEIAEK